MRRYDGKYRKGRRIRSSKYKEDSTKGGALMNNPKTFKRDVLVQVWCDSRDLATLSEWLDRTDGYTRFMSEVVQNSLSAVVAMLVDSGEVSMIEDTAVARELLSRKYRVDLNPSGKGLKNAHHNLLLSEKRKGLSEFVKRREVFVPTPLATDDVGTDRGFLSKEKLDEQVEIYKKLEIEDAAQQGRDNMKRFLEENKPDERGAMIPIGEVETTTEMPAVTTVAQQSLIIDSKRDPSVVDNLKTGVLDELIASSKAKVKVKKGDDRARTLTAEELEAKAIEIAKKDQDYIKSLKETPVPVATAVE